MTATTTRQHGDAARWAASALAVLVMHAGVAYWLASRPLPPPPEAQPPALMLELAPLPSTPPAEQPQPEPVAQPEAPPPMPEAPPPEPPPPPEPSPPPEPIPPPPPPEAVVPEVVLPTPPPTPVKPPPPKPHPVAARPRPQTPPPPVVAQPQPQTEAAPAQPAAPPASASAAAATWQSRLLAHLTRFKRYPAAAQMRREQGVALLRFTMTRAGAVLTFRLERGSGYQLLDQETLDLIQRAQPLPPLPPEIVQETLELVIPLRFELK